MVLASTIIAVALGLTPVHDGQVLHDSAAVARQVGRFSERTDRHGVRHLQGFDQYGRPYEVTVDANGRVEGVIGASLLEFTVAEVN
jgi:hypothetical protein